MTINLQVSAQYHLDAALALDEALAKMDPARVERMRLLGGQHQPPGGPALKFTNEALVFLAEALAGAFGVIAAQQERIDGLEREVKTLLKKAASERGEAKGEPTK